jgi:hypothetical protein
MNNMALFVLKWRESAEGAAYFELSTSGGKPFSLGFQGVLTDGEAPLYVEIPYVHGLTWNFHVEKAGGGHSGDIDWEPERRSAPEKVLNVACGGEHTCGNVIVYLGSRPPMLVAALPENTSV